jgi:hypothetical protein
MVFIKRKQVFPCVAVTAWSLPATYGTEDRPDPRRGPSGEGLAWRTQTTEWITGAARHASTHKMRWAKIHPLGSGSAFCFGPAREMCESGRAKNRCFPGPGLGSRSAIVDQICSLSRYPMDADKHMACNCTLYWRCRSSVAA